MYGEVVTHMELTWGVTDLCRDKTLPIESENVCHLSKAKMCVKSYLLAK